jgi:VWFA-related protein
MKNLRSLLPLLALAVIGPAAPLLAQSSQPAPYIETFDVRLHDLDVIVTDRAGKPVTGLRKEDFLVTENGAPQTISNFTVFGGSTGNAANGGTASAADVNDETGGRRFVFFIDELALHPYTRNKMIAHASDLIRSAMKPGDEAMIITPAAEEKVALPFTGDVDAVLAGIKKVFMSTGTRTTTQTRREQEFLERQLAASPRSDRLYGDTSVEQQRRQVKRMYARAVTRRVDQRLGQLRSIVAALAETPGRKVLILATESLSATPGVEAFRADTDRGIDENSDVRNEGVVGERTAAVETGKGDGDTDSRPDTDANWSDKRGVIREIARKASTNGITIYALQPEFGLRIAAPGGIERRSNVSLSVVNPTYIAQVNAGTETTLSTLAEMTGGKWYRGDGPVGDAFRQVVSDITTYYSLGYPAPEGKSDVARAINVTVKGRPELLVRFRKELVEKSVAQEMTDQVVASLLVPRTKNELNIDVTTEVAAFNGSTREVTVQVDVPMDKLLFLPDGADTYKAQFSVHYAAAGQSADFMAGENRMQYVALSPEQYANIGNKYWKYVTKLRVPMSSMNIAVGVMDTTSRLTGFQTVKLEASQPMAAKR